MIPGSRLRVARLVISLAVLSLVLGGVASAQQRERRGGPGGGRDTEQRIAMMTERLSLTEKQQEEVRKIFAEREVKAREMMRESREAGGDRDARRKQMMAFREETQSAVEAVLDEKQTAKYREMRNQRRAAMESRRSREGRPRRGGPPQAAPPEADAEKE